MEYDKMCPTVNLDDRLCILHAVPNISDILLKAFLHDWCHIAHWNVSPLVIKSIAEAKMFALFEHSAKIGGKYCKLIEIDCELPL